MRPWKSPFVLLLLSLWFNATNAQHDTIMVDFGSSTYLSVFPWNNITDPALGQLPNLVNSQGYSTQLGITIHDAFTAVNTNGTQQPDPLLGIPSAASRDNFFGNTQVFGGQVQATGGFTLTGLNLGKTYTLVLFASRIASDNRETRYVVIGNTIDSLVLAVSSNWSQVVSTTMLPDSQGHIQVIASAGPNNNNAYGFYHLGALKLIYDHEPLGQPSLSLHAPNGNEVWQVGKSPQIQWQSTNISLLYLAYSFDNGMSWNLIDTVPAYLKTYTWLVPNTPSGNCLIRISSDSLFDISDQGFEIAGDSLVCRVVVLGSSTAAGAGASSLDSSWVERYQHFLQQRNTRFQVINLSKGGFTTYHILPTGTYIPPGVTHNIDTNRNVSKALSFAPFFILINLPSNDAAYNYSVLQQLNNYDIITGAIASAGAGFYISTPQPRNFSNANQLQSQHTMVDSILARYPGKSMDFWHGLADSLGHIKPDFNSGDGIHLNNAGHFFLFQRVLLLKADTTDCSLIVGTNLTFKPSQEDIRLYPNPFTHALKISFYTSSPAYLTIHLHDMLGRQVGYLDTRILTAGSQVLEWCPPLHGRDNSMFLLASIRILNKDGIRSVTHKLMRMAP